MNDQQELPLQHTPQLTSWLKGAPQHVGWFNTRIESDTCPEAVERRYWNGNWWSQAVTIGADDDTCLKKMYRRGYISSPSMFEYQGLVEPHPGAAPTRRRLEVKHA